MIRFLFPLEVEEEEEFDQYISEDREAEVARNRKTAQRVQTAILQDLRQVLGVKATLPENATKDLILQVIIITTLVQYRSNKPTPLLIVFESSSTTYSTGLIVEYSRD